MEEMRAYNCSPRSSLQTTHCHSKSCAYFRPYPRHWIWACRHSQNPSTCLLAPLGHLRRYELHGTYKRRWRCWLHHWTSWTSQWTWHPGRFYQIPYTSQHIPKPSSCPWTSRIGNWSLHLSTFVGEEKVRGEMVIKGEGRFFSRSVIIIRRQGFIEFTTLVSTNASTFANYSQWIYMGGYTRTWPTCMFLVLAR